MDCYRNNMDCRNDCPQNRRSRSYRQTIPVTGRSAPGGSYMSCRNNRNPGRSTDCGCEHRPPMQNDCRCRETVSSGCGCPTERGCLTDVMRASEKMPVGMTYTPYQEFSCLYEWDTALDQGTLFSDLNKPFLMTNCSQGGGRL